MRLEYLDPDFKEMHSGFDIALRIVDATCAMWPLP